MVDQVQLNKMADLIQAKQNGVLDLD